MTRRALIGIFLAIPVIAVFQAAVRITPPSEGATAAARWLYFLYTLFSAFALPGIAAFFLIIAARTVLHQRRIFEGVSLAQQGRLKGAREALRATGTPKWSPLTAYNLGVVELPLWEVTSAISSLERAWKYGGSRRMRALAAPQLALATALAGNTIASEAWLRATSELQVGETAAALLARAVLALRAGRWSEAADLLERYEMNALSGPVRGLREALRAWCAETRTGERRLLDRVALFGEVGPERLQALWPELIAFTGGPQSGQAAG